MQRNYQKAKDAFFKGDGGYPDLKKKGRCRESYTTNCSNKSKPNLVLNGNMLKLPKIKTPVRLNLHRKIREGGTLKNCTVSHDVTGWYFSLQFEYPKATGNNTETVSSLPDKTEPSHIGLDMSLPYLFVDSNGNMPDFVKPYRAMEDRLKREQKKLSRMLKADTDHYETDEKGYKHPVYIRPPEECKNYQKQKCKVARLHARITHQRDDMLHKISAELTDRYDIISIEDLDMSAIKKSLKFGKSAGDIGWGKFTDMLAYKQERKNHRLIKINRWFPSSKTCIHCGYVHKELKLSDRTYVCPKCGNVMNRDRQAGMNIDMEGMRMFYVVVKHFCNTCG